MVRTDKKIQRNFAYNTEIWNYFLAIEASTESREAEVQSHLLNLLNIRLRMRFHEKIVAEMSMNALAFYRFQLHADYPVVASNEHTTYSRFVGGGLLLEGRVRIEDLETEATRQMAKR